MIEINLLPEDRRPRKASPADEKFFMSLLVIPLVILALVVSHAYLGVMYIVKSSRVNVLSAAWKQMEPERVKLEGMKNKIAASSSDARAVNDILSNRIVYAEKLQKLSEYLPSGIWFNDIFFSRKELIVKGSVVSLRQDELELISSLRDAMVNDKDFMKNFNSVEMGPVQRRSIGTYEVLDFIFTAQVKSTQVKS